MFEESLVESTTLIRTRNRWPVVASVAAQLAVLALIITVPLLHPEVLPFHAPKLSVLAPPPAPKPPPTPPPQPVRIQAASASAAPQAPSQATQQMRELLRLANTTPVDTPILTTGTQIASLDTSLPLGFGTSGPPSPNVTVAPTSGARASNKPLNVSSGVTAGLLINPIAPIYPQIAKMTGTQGTVIIQAIISKAGRIESARVISGPPLLRDAALAAVNGARYHPYLLNNEPTEVETTISINFHLGS
jgi:protein TonB